LGAPLQESLIIKRNFQTPKSTVVPTAAATLMGLALPSPASREIQLLCNAVLIKVFLPLKTRVSLSNIATILKDRPPVKMNEKFVQYCCSAKRIARYG